MNLHDLLEVHDRHLRGTRFDWEKFISKEFHQMAEDVLKRISEKNKEKELKESVNRIKNSQVNILSCVERWAREAPVVIILYELLCEMIHPNLGSTFLVSSISNGELSFGKRSGTPAAHSLFETTLGWLMPVGYKEFGKLIGALMLTKYQQDELTDEKSA